MILFILSDQGHVKRLLTVLKIPVCLLAEAVHRLGALQK